MKLAIITTRYPRKDNPYNHMFVHVRATYFKKKNVDVEVFVLSTTNSVYEHEGIKVNLMTSKRIIEETSAFDISYLHLVNNYFCIKNGGNRIYKSIIKKRRPFAIYIHGSEILKYPNYLFDFKFNLRGILKYFYVNYWNHAKMKFFFSQTIPAKNSLFLFPSHWMKDHTELVLNKKLLNFEIIPNGIDTELFQFSNHYENRFKLMMIRPLSDLKYGFDMAIEMMRYLPPEYSLTIYGKGSYENDCKKRIDKYNLTNRVTIINSFIERNNIPEIFSNFGVFIATTRFDSQGVTMCEAMASGLLTVSNPVTAIPEFIQDGENGLLDNSMENLAKKIVKVTSDENLYLQITKSARQSMEKISIDNIGEKELNVLKDLIE